MSALLWHADAAKHISAAFKAQAESAAESHEYPDARLLMRFSMAYDHAADTMLDQLRSPAVSRPSASAVEQFGSPLAAPVSPIHDGASDSARATEL